MRSISSIALWLLVIGTPLVLVPVFTKTSWSCRFGRPERRRRWQKGIRSWGCRCAPDAFYGRFSGRLWDSSLSLALVTSFGTPPRHLAWRVAASGLLLLVSIATLVYFRPAIIGMVVDHGAGRTPEALAEEAHRWVALNWVRILAVAASLAMGVQALLLR